MITYIFNGKHVYMYISKPIGNPVTFAARLS